MRDKFNTPLSIDESMMIWVRVMLQAQRDATFGLCKYWRKGIIPNLSSNWKPPAGYVANSREAQLWFLDPTLDFDEVCGYLRLHPDAVHEEAVRMFRALNSVLPSEYLIMDLNEKVLV